MLMADYLVPTAEASGIGDTDWKKCATMKGCYLGEERSVEVISLSTDVLPDGGKIVGPIALSSSDFASTYNKARLVREDQRGSTASHSEKKNTREASNSEGISTSLFGLEDIQRLFGSKREDAANSLGERRLTLEDCVRQDKLPDLSGTLQVNTVEDVYKKRRTLPLPRWTEQVRVCSGTGIGPLDDGYSWRKYGQKDILGANFPKAYYRCTHQNVQGCLATKQVQRSDKDYSIFEITYRGRHTCIQTPALASNGKEFPKQRKENSQPHTQSPRSFGGLTAELASSSHWPIDLPDGQQILQLDSLELITNAVAHGARADQSYPVESRSEKKMMRKTIKRKCRTMSGISLENLQQNLDSKCEDAVKSLGVKRVCRQRGIYRVSKVKRIRRQHGIHQWPFRQKWAAMKGSSLGEERSFENSGLCVDEKLDSRLRTIPTPQLARYSSPPIPLLDGGNIVGPIALSLREIGGRLADAAKSLGGFQTLDSLVRKSLEALETLSRQEQPSDITYSLSEGRLTLKGCARQGKLPDPLLRTLQIYAVEERVTQLPRSLGGLTPQSASSSHWLISSPDGQQIVQLNSLEQSRDNVVHGARADQKCRTISLAEKKIFRKTLKRKWRTTSVICLEDLQQHYGSWCEYAAKSNCISISAVKRICTPLGIRRVSTMKRICRQHGIHRWPSRLSASTSHWPINLPYGGQIMQLDSVERSRNSVAHGARVDQSCPTASLSEKKMVRRTLKRRCTTTSVISSDELQHHFGSRCEDAVKCLFVSVSTVKYICRQHGIHKVSTVKRIRRQHLFHRWPFRQKCATMKGYYLGEERSVEVISLSTDGKRDLRHQFIHISQLSRSSPWPIALPDGGEIVGPIALSSSDFASTNNKARLVREDQRGSTASHSEKKNTREASNRKGKSRYLVGSEDLQRLHGRKRKDAANSLGVSESTFKRICRHNGIEWWPYPIRNNVWKPPDPQGEKNASPTCKTLSANRQTALENEGVGQHQVPNEFLPDSIGGPNSWNSENGLLEDVIRTPTLHDSCTDNYLDVIPLHIAPIFKERVEAGGSSEWGLQLRDLTYTNPDTLEFPLPQMTSTQMVSENMEISQDWRNLLASPTEAFQEVNVSGSSNWTVPTSFDPALSQPTRSIPHTMPIIPSMLPISPRIMPTITHMTSHLTAGEDVSYVTLKPKYGRTTMKFHFPTKYGITELKEEVSKRLELELGSFNIEYKDEDGDNILIGCDEDFRLCLQRFSPLGTQAIRLSVIDKDPIATNICES